MTLSMEHAGAGLQLDVVYELGDRDFFIRRRLELTTAKPLALRQVDAWLVGIDGKCSHEGFGAPVLLDDTFWGLEFPGGGEPLRRRAGRAHPIPGPHRDGSFHEQDGRGRRGRAGPHRAMVPTLRRDVPPAVARSTPLFVNYNTWWTLMPPTEKNCLELIDLFQQKLFEPYGESIDTFTIDDGWDDKNSSLWAIRPKAVPARLRAAGRSAGRTMKARLGLWLSPSSGYSHAPWLAKQRLRAEQQPWFLCHPVRSTAATSSSASPTWPGKYNVAFFKFDGFCATCEAAGPRASAGAVRQGGQHRRLHRADDRPCARPGPNMYLDPTCGIWLSPWWLQYADSLWGEVSGDYPDIIVPAPIVRDSATTTRDARLPPAVPRAPRLPAGGHRAPGDHRHHAGEVGRQRDDRRRPRLPAADALRQPEVLLTRRPRLGVPGLDAEVGPAQRRHAARHRADPRRSAEAGAVRLRPLPRQCEESSPFAIRSSSRKTVGVKLDDSLGLSRAESQSSAQGYQLRTVYPRHEILPGGKGVANGQAHERREARDRAVVEDEEGGEVSSSSPTARK